MSAIKVLKYQVPGTSEIYCHLTVPDFGALPPTTKRRGTIVLHLTNLVQGDACPMGSVVYSVPTTYIFNQEATIEFAARVAQVLTKRLELPVIVSASVYGDALGTTAEIAGILRFVQKSLEASE
ncbi:hypothetical protein DV451_003373 [Geotrichum candidum]|uniref:Uncharacterized protein n=1 Tax=Geotrichum candidum TaxID=1173061 RepID=A0A9P5KRL9_GEOCN|nr:hypothetical protein DV451_003373 [Geotrichum candidum]KAF5106846.1 hypothetical protein DV453_003570 [Geotrichum candidum]KAF7501926.1 hypothetical protein DV113_000060 [Geotrichum candidum]